MLFSEIHNITRKTDRKENQYGSTFKVTGEFKFNKTAISHSQSSTKNLNYEMMRKPNVMLLDQSEELSGIGAYLVADHGQATLYKPHKPALHGLQYIVYVQAGKKHFLTDMTLIPPNLRTWINSVFVYESGAFQSPFETKSREGLTQKQQEALDWWFSFTELPEEFITFTTKNEVRSLYKNKPVDYSVILTIISAYLDYLEAEKLRVKDEKEEKYKAGVIQLINSGQFNKAASTMGLTYVAEALSVMKSHVIDEWNPKEMKDATEYVTKLYELDSVRKEQERVIRDSNTGEVIKATDPVTSGLASEATQSALYSMLLGQLNELYNSNQFFKDMIRLQSLNVTPVLTLAKLKGAGESEVKLVMEKVKKESKNIKLMLTEPEPGKNTYGKIQEILQAYEDVKRFNETRRSLVQNASDSGNQSDWILEAVKEPFHDYYDEKYPEDNIKFFRNMLDYAGSSLQISGASENEESLLSLVGKKTEFIFPNEFWDLTIESVNAANELVYETYKTFTKSVKNNKSPFAVTFYQTATTTGVESMEDYEVVEHSLWHNMTEVKDEFEAVKEFKRFIPFKKEPAVKMKKQAVPSGANSLDPFIEVVNHALQPLYKKFNNLQKQYVKVEKEIEKEKEKYHDVMKKLVDVINRSPDEINTLFKQLEKFAPTLKGRWELFNVLQQLPASYDLKISDDARGVVNILSTVTNEDYMKKMEEMSKNWKIFFKITNQTDSGTPQTVRTMVFNETMEKLRSGFLPKINKLINERIKEAQKRFKTVSQTREKWEAIEFILSDKRKYTISKNDITTTNYEFAERLDQMHTAFEEDFSKDLPEFLQRGIAETFAINTETIEDVNNAEIANNIFTTLGEITALITIQELGLFPTHLFHTNILADEDYLVYILTKALYEYFPRLFFILDGIRYGQVSEEEILTGTNNMYNILLSSKNIFKEEDMFGTPPLANSSGVSINKRYIENTDDKDQIYANLKIKERKITLSTALSMIRDDSFYTTEDYPPMSVYTQELVYNPNNGKMRDLQGTTVDPLLSIIDRRSNLTLREACMKPLRSITFITDYYEFEAEREREDQTWESDVEEDVEMDPFSETGFDVTFPMEVDMGGTTAGDMSLAAEIQEAAQAATPVTARGMYDMIAPATVRLPPRVTAAEEEEFQERTGLTGEEDMESRAWRLVQLVYDTMDVINSTDLTSYIRSAFPEVDLSKVDSVTSLIFTFAKLNIIDHDLNEARDILIVQLETFQEIFLPPQAVGGGRASRPVKLRLESVSSYEESASEEESEEEEEAFPLSEEEEFSEEEVLSVESPRLPKRILTVEVEDIEAHVRLERRLKEMTEEFSNL